MQFELALFGDFRESPGPDRSVGSAIRSQVTFEIPLTNHTQAKMSTDSFSTTTGKSPGLANHQQVDVETHKSSEPPAPHAINHDLVNETRNQIRSLVDEVAQLAESDCSSSEFYQGFLTRTTSALASIGGAVWHTGDGAALRLEYHVNIEQSGITDDHMQPSHARLLHQVIDTGEPMLVPPKSGSPDDEGAGNPTNHLLLIGPLVVDQQVV